MKKTKEDAEKKAVKKPSLAPLRGAKLAVAPPSAGATAPGSGSGLTPRGSIHQKATPGSSSAAAPKGLWEDPDDEDDKDIVPTRVASLAAPPSSATAATPAAANAPRPALVVAGVRPLEETRSGVLPKRHLSLSPARKRGRSFSRSPSPPPKAGEESRRGRSIGCDGR